MSRHVSLKFTLAAVFVVALVAFLAGSYSAPTPATAQAPIRWKVQTAWPPTSIVQDAAKLLVETIEKTSVGRLKKDLLPAGAIVPAFEVQDAVNRGVIDAGRHAVAPLVPRQHQRQHAVGQRPGAGVDAHRWPWPGDREWRVRRHGRARV